MAQRETENNVYAKFWDDKQRVLWYVMVFSGVVNYLFQESSWVMLVLDTRLATVLLFGGKG